MRETSHQIDGARDFELGIERTGKVTYYCTAPALPAKGLVFIIPGFGDDAAAEYNQLLRRYLSGRYGLVAVMVAYHASQARPPAARIEVDLQDIHRIIGILALRNIHLDLEGLTIDRVLSDIDKLAIPCTIAAKLIPPNGDYQNFGVMQAIDHICALNHILDSGIEFDTNNILCLGSSHGAYIAHLIHKFAPNSVNGVIDNSGYAIPVAQYLGGRPEYLQPIGNVTLACNVVTRWNFADTYSAGYFGPARYAIRDTKNGKHLAEIAAKSVRPCQFRELNSYVDGISPLEVKQAQVRALQSNGFDVQLRVIREGDIDGKVLKSLNHGLDASINGIFDLFADSLSVRPTTLDRELRTSLEFECYDYVYRVRHSDVPPYFEASCERID